MLDRFGNWQDRISESCSRLASINHVHHGLMDINRHTKVSTQFVATLF